VHFLPNFQRPLAAKLHGMTKRFWRCKNGMDLLYHHAKYGGYWTSPATEGVGGGKLNAFFVKFFYLCVMLMNGKVCECDFPMKLFEYGNYFAAIG